MANGATYNGPPAFIEGIPARDLSMEEWAAIPEGLRDMAIDTGVYTLGGPKRKSPKRGEPKISDTTDEVGE